MTVEEAIRQRRSIRQYTNDPVSTVDIREMLRLAGMAPNVANRQMWRFIAVTDPNMIRMLHGLVRHQIDEMAGWQEFAGQKLRLEAWRDQAQHFLNAPAIILFVNQGYRTPIDPMLTERGMKFWEIPHLFGYPDVQSIGALIAYFTLLATDRGYGTCWLTAPLTAKKDLQIALETKPGEDIVALVTLGRPAEIPPPKDRKAVDGLIEWR